MTFKRYKPINLKKRKQIKKSKPIFKNRVFRDLLLTCLLFALAGYLFFYSNFFKIKRFEVFFEEPTNNFFKEEQKRLAKDMGNFLIAQLDKNLLFFNSEILKEKIEADYQEIEGAGFAKIFPDKIFLKIKQKSQRGSFCFDKDSCFLFDKQGKIFYSLKNMKKAMVELFTNEIKIFDSQQKYEKLGQIVLPKEAMDKIFKIQENLTNNLQVTTTMFVLNGQERVDAETNEGWQIYFDLQSDLNLSLTKLKLLLEKEISLEKRKNLKYIDLRFSKIYYK